ncbi:hypothetical protein [Streptomyces sp. NRRL B-3648]|uniref:hypothetical protein n=1 Tax=Streptomyces sp. NRRL B-3648 TaxID=1519493 RepID=UPI0006B00129|nr:hypothetical protein [Streptomyces sp. NRRL B-3648]
MHELTALRAAAQGRPVQLLVNCWYGRHRALVIADAIGRRMREPGARVQVTQRHINRPPVPRKHPRPDCPFRRIIHEGAPATIGHEWSDALAITPRSGGCTDGHPRITAALDGRETTLLPGHRVSVRYAPLDVSDRQLFADPYEAYAVALLDAGVAG